MAGLEIIDTNVAEPSDGHALGRPTSGQVTSRWGAPANFPLWLLMIEMADGAELRWDAAHGDEAVYVRGGELEVSDGRICPTSGCVVVEADAQTSVRARGNATVVHMGPHDPAPPRDGINGAPDPNGHNVHVVGPRGTYAVSTTDRETHFYADSTCPTCRLTLLYTSRTSRHDSEAHSHSQDELIHLLSGSIRLGNKTIEPGVTLAIAADQRYGFVSDDGFAFINYRADASRMTRDREQPPLPEGGEANGLEPVMDLI